MQKRIKKQKKGFQFSLLEYKMNVYRIIFGFLE